MEILRRTVVTGVGAAGLVGLMGAPAVAGRARIAGFEPEPWFAESSLDLAKDLAAAAAAGKFLALLWEQNGCHYCAELHAVNFQDPEIVNYGKTHFHTIQMDLWGDRKIKDFDGETRTEGAIARGRFVRATPVMLFFDAKGTEVFRMPGYAPPPLFMAVYQFVAEKGFEAGSFRSWVKNRHS